LSENYSSYSENGYGTGGIPQCHRAAKD